MALKEKNQEKNQEIYAKASCQNLPVSSKHCIEACKMLRYKTTTLAKKMLEEVLNFDRAIPFPKFARDIAHRPGIGSGRYPQKASKYLLYLINSVEANAQAKNLDVNHLKIVKILANRAPIPRTGGRFRHGTKRTHLEIEVKEVKHEDKKSKDSSKESSKGKKTEEKKKGTEMKKVTEKKPAEGEKQ